MGLYATHIFPRLMDWVMRGDEFQHLRRSLLQDVRGEVLEIGFGTGLNLPHYSEKVARLHAVDPAPFLPTRVAERIRAVAFPVQIENVSAEMLPFEDCTFDRVVSTWTLCTIPDPVQALREIRRVLTPDGKFLFLEHGRSEDKKVAVWQDRLNPVQNIIGCGCNLNRKIDHMIIRAGLKIMILDRFQMQGVPQLGGEMYRGIAALPDSVTSLHAEAEKNRQSR